MRLGLLPLCLLFAAGSVVPDPVTGLAGRYSSHFPNGDVSGANYWSDDVAEIVPVDRSHAYLRFELAFFNGHLCSLAGVARVDGHGLTYRDRGDVSGDGSTCMLHVERRGSKLAWEDGAVARCIAAHVAASAAATCLGRASARSAISPA